MNSSPSGNGSSGMICISGICFLKDSWDASHFIIEINVGKRRIRFRTTLKFNDVIFNRCWVDLEIHHSISGSLYVGSASFEHWFQKWKFIIVNINLFVDGISWIDSPPHSYTAFKRDWNPPYQEFSNLFLGYIDVDDGCCSRNVLTTILRCWRRFLPFLSPTSSIFYHERRAPLTKRCH